MARSHMAHQLRSYRHTLLAVALLLVMPAVGQASDYWAPQGGEKPSPPSQEPVATSNPNDDRWNWYGSNYLYTADNPPAASVPVPVPQHQFSNFFRGKNDRPWGEVPETSRGNWYDSGSSPAHNPWGGSSRQPPVQEPYRWDRSQGGEAGRSEAGRVFGWDPYQPQQRPQPQPGADFPSSQQQYYGAPEQRPPHNDPYYQREGSDRYRQPDDSQAGSYRENWEYRDQRDGGGYSRDPGGPAQDYRGSPRDAGGYATDRDGYRDWDGYGRNEGYFRDRGGYQDYRERYPEESYAGDPYYRYRDERRDYDDRDRLLDPWTERNPMVNWWRNSGPMHWMDRRGEGW